MMLTEYSLLPAAKQANDVYDARRGDIVLGNIRVRVQYYLSSICVAIAGSNDITDWSYNLRFLPRSTPQGLAHGGLVLEARKVYAALKKVLYEALKSGKDIEIVGHSAGGAIAQLVAELLAADNGRASLFLRVVTFAAPEIYVSAGNPSINVIRVEHEDDPVPKCAFFYKHRQSQIVRLDDSGIVSVFDHSMKKYLHIISQRHL